MVAGWLAISGLPLLSGFFSKDAILFRTFTTEVLPAPWPKILWFIAAGTALLTAIYMTRLITLTFRGEERFANTGESSEHGDEGLSHHSKPRESPKSMLIPLVVLAVGAVFVGYIGVPHFFPVGENHFESFIRPSVEDVAPYMDTIDVRVQKAHFAEEQRQELALAVVSSLIAVIGIGLGWVWFNRKPLWQPPKLLEQKYYVDEIYDAAVVQPIKQGSTNVLWKIVDVHIIDGAVNGAGHLATMLGGVMRYMQSGLARSYVAVLVLGALLIIGYFVIR
jgi:NADH-quinone oxidoreductase subunit L